MNRDRIDAEAIRDTVLLVSGQLDLSMGGPGYRDFGFLDDHSPHYKYQEYDPDDATTHRRSIYRLVVRSVPNPFMETLDCADPSLLTPRRNTTLTALQALSLLNNQFMVRQGDKYLSLALATGELRAVLEEAELAGSRRLPVLEAVS